jgi:uncharacterized protein (TIGR02594 family)
MRLVKQQAAILLCSMALAGMTGSAWARPGHGTSHQRQAADQAQFAYGDGLYAFMRKDWEKGKRHGRRHASRRARRPSPRTASAPRTTSVFGGFGSNALIAEARKYIGTNPTGRRRLWCGAFMDMVLRRTGHEGGGNLALGYAHYGQRISGPRVGAIAVMSRRGGGHVGIVTGIDSNGNPIIISGNHNHTVAEAVYPRGRISAYVVPTN